MQSIDEPVNELASEPGGGPVGEPGDEPVSEPVSEPVNDGRRTRWEQHRRDRHAELVSAAIDAIVRHGPGVDMAQVARVAGVSKPVLYRYFADKAQLWRAVGERVAASVVGAVAPAIERVREERPLIWTTIDAYLAAIESNPELYRYLMSHAEDGISVVVSASSRTTAAALARVIGDRLRALGLDAGPAEPWAYGMVAMVQAVGDWWMAQERPMSRTALTEYLTTLLWQGIAGVRESADLPHHLLAPQDRT
ncbi:TetR family transcriptional regulator [Rugosimonospora africana]|uniref:TetR family transcriptional regulator n=1 Tax=Rugosimonospora africana TaxID=556532 RepID=UPI001EF2B606|nr:TetR family transcriptional regulator [Rugosimonospora africana]